MKYKHVFCIFDEVSNELVRLEKEGFTLVNIVTLGDKNKNDLQIIVKK